MRINVLKGLCTFAGSNMNLSKELWKGSLILKMGSIQLRRIMNERVSKYTCSRALCKQLIVAAVTIFELCLSMVFLHPVAKYIICLLYTRL